MGNVNYDAMRIRLEFLYRILCECNDADGFIDGHNASHFIATVSTQLICKHRVDGTFQISPAERNLWHGFGLLVAEGLNDITQKIIRETEGLPITLTFGKREITLQVGLDELMDRIKGLFASVEREVSNG